MWVYVCDKLHCWHHCGWPAERQAQHTHDAYNHLQYTQTPLEGGQSPDSCHYVVYYQNVRMGLWALAREQLGSGWLAGNRQEAQLLTPPYSSDTPHGIQEDQLKNTHIHTCSTPWLFKNSLQHWWSTNSLPFWKSSRWPVEIHISYFKFEINQ